MPNPGLIILISFLEIFCPSSKLFIKYMDLRNFFDAISKPDLLKPLLPLDSHASLQSLTKDLNSSGAREKLESGPIVSTLGLKCFSIVVNRLRPLQNHQRPFQ